MQELWVAVAGPLINVVIATSIFLGLAIGSVVTLWALGSFLWQLALANVVLVVFNMIPAFPMDRERVLRATLALFMDYAVATNIVTAVDQVSAIGLGFLGMVGQAGQ